MSKKLFRTIGKVAGVIGAVAAVIPGLNAIGLGLKIAAGTLRAVTAISAIVAIGASALGKPKSPKTPPGNLDRLNANIDPRTPRKMVFGETAMATDIRDQELSSDQSILHRFIVVASHKVQSIDTIYLDDKLAWTVGGGAQGEFVGYLTVTPIMEGTAANAINISARMGTSRRYTGLAYVHVQFKLTGNSKKTESPFAQNVPTRMTIKGKGLPTYDPRLDSTAGGSGSHRANDQTTWGWDDNASNNPAIQLLNYYLGWKINGILAVGKGIPSARIDLASFITAANICDESVALSGGGTQPRYRSACLITEADALDLVNENFKAAMNAELDDAEGKIRLTVLHNDLASPVADFTDDDVLGNVDWQPFAPLEESYNAIRGVYTDPSANSLYQQVDYPQPTPLTPPDGIERMLPFDLPIVENSARAQRLSKQRLQREQYQGTLSFEGGQRYWKVQKNDIIRQTFTPLGFSLKLFRVVKIGVRVDGVVPIVLREENAAIYAWSAEDSAGVVAAAPTLYDFTKGPYFQDVVAAIDTADNLILNASLALDASQWSFTGAVTRSAGGASDPVAGYLSFPASAATYAFTNNDSFISLSGLTKLYLSGLAYAESGAGSGFLIVVAWFKAGGTASAITTSSYLDILPVAASTWTPWATNFAPPSDAALCKVYFQRNNTTGAVRAAGLRVAKTEPAADVTQVISGPTSHTIKRNNDGTPKTGELALDLNFKMTRGASTDVTASTSWSALLKSGMATFTPTVGSPNTTGTLNVTAVGDGSVITMTGTYNGVARSIDIVFPSDIDPPPTSGGGGSGASGSASDNTISQTTSTYYGSANSDILSVVAGSGGSVALTFPGNFKRTTNGTNGAVGKWQWRVVGGSFADVASEIFSSLDADRGGSPEPHNDAGYIEVTMNKTGLTNGTTYEFQLLLRNDASGTCNWTGTASAVAS